MTETIEKSENYTVPETMLPKEDEIKKQSENHQKKFEDNIEELKAFSENIPEKEELPTVDNDGGLFNLFSHKVTGEELNKLTSKIQNKMIEQNKHIVKLIEEFGVVYNTMESLDNDYLKNFKKDIENIRKVNEKSGLCIDGLEEKQYQIDKLIDNQKSIISALSKFKEKIEKIEHITEVDDIFDNVIIIQNEAHEISDLLYTHSSEIEQINNKIGTVSALQSEYNIKLTRYNSEKSKQDEVIRDLSEQNARTEAVLDKTQKENRACVETLNNKICETENKIQKNDEFYKAEISSLNNSAQADKSELSEKIVTLNGQVDSLKTEITNLQQLSDKLFGFLKLFAISFGSAVFVLFVLIILLMGGIL